ncbi:MAG: hypothetical protein P4M13_03880 [Alphaproteobacteria bacterium]|nr:hypothetical protein [Alphaproteobacteria bacterium]
MIDDHFFHLIHETMRAAHRAEQEQALEEDEHRAANEECDKREGHTIEELKKKTGLSADQIRAGMKNNEDQLAHRVANGDEARYDLLQHREGHPNWEPGIDF